MLPPLQEYAAYAKAGSLAREHTKHGFDKNVRGCDHHGSHVRATKF